MPRIDHVAVESHDPDAVAAFYERIFGARIDKQEGHPVRAVLGGTAFAFHEVGGPGEHTAVRVSTEEQDELKRRLDEAAIEWEERDHDGAVGVFFADTEGRRLEAIAYGGGEEPRRPSGRLGDFQGIDRSLPTDARAQPARPEDGTASGAYAGVE